MPNEHPMMSREEYQRRFPDEGERVERRTGDQAWTHLPEGWERKYKCLAFAVNDMPNTCDDQCDSYGHSEGCGDKETRWPAEKIVALQEEIERLRLSGDGTPPTEDGAYCVRHGNITHCHCGLPLTYWRGRAEPGEGERREIKEARPE